MLCGRFVSVAEADDVLAPLRLHLRRALCCNSKSRLCAEQDTFCTCILSSRVFKLNLWMMCPLLHSFLWHGCLCFTLFYDMVLRLSLLTSVFHFATETYAAAC